MKKLTLLLPIAALMAYLMLSSYSSGITGYSFSGCSAGAGCHPSASANTVLTLSGVPASGWQPSTTYTMTATVSNSAQAAGGFNLSVALGTLSNPSAGTALNGNTEIRHTTPKSFTGGSASWTFSWTAPSAGTQVNFNMAGNAVNLNSTSSGDVPNTALFILNKSTTTTAPTTPGVTANGSTTVCPGQAFPTLTATSSGADSFKWFNGGTLVATTVAGNYTPTTPGIYTVTAKNALGTSTASAGITLTVATLPSAVFTKTNTTGTTWNFTYTTPGLTYLWTFGEGSATSTAQTPSYTYTTNGTKTVKLRVTNAAGCRDSSTQTVNITTSIAGVAALAAFRFGPNPAHGTLLLHTGALKADVRLLDLSGKAVATLRTRAEATAEKTVSLAQIAAGLYFLEVTTDEARGVEKLLVR